MNTLTLLKKEIQNLVFYKIIYFFCCMFGVLGIIENRKDYYFYICNIRILTKNNIILNHKSIGLTLITTLNIKKIYKI